MSREAQVNGPPGPALSALLADLDLPALADGEVVDVLRASWRQVSHAFARHLEAMAEVGHRCEPAWATSEIEGALTFTARRADYEHTFAQVLVTRLPLVLAALRTGAVDHHKARVFADYLADLDDAQIAVICARLVPRAPGWTTGQLAHRLLREVLAVDAHHTRRRYQRAVAERGVSGFLGPDGTATITAHGLTPGEAAAAADRLDQLAAAVCRAGHPASIHQLRADLFVRLLDGRYNGFTIDQIVAAMLAEPRDPEPLAPSGTAAAAGGPESGAPDGRSDPEYRHPRGRGPSDDGSGESGPDERSDDEGGPDEGGPDEGGPDESGPGDSGPDGGGPNDGNPGDGNPGDGGPGDGGPGDGGPGDGGPTPGPTTDGGGGGVAGVPLSTPTPVPGVRIGVEVRIGLTTLLGLDEHPAELPGWGPIPADDARLLTHRQHAAQWCYAITDDEGYLLHGGTTRARPRTAATSTCRGGVVEIHICGTRLAQLADSPDLPSEWARFVADLGRRHTTWQTRPDDPDTDPDAGLDEHPRSRLPHHALRRHVRMRDRTCVAPGCRRPARRADQDHTRDHVDGGTTVRANLGPLCRRHHLMKHTGGWTLTQPEPGRFHWRSPLQQTYRTRGDPIAPDLPDPLPRSDESDEQLHCGRTYDGPIFPCGPDTSVPPKRAGPPTVLDDDGPPPF